ncbi:hypothetical protein CPB84DRAFT_1760037, partial [Gymnopilus junonius]
MFSPPDLLLLLSFLLLSVSAQSSTSASASLSLSLSLTTASQTLTLATSRPGGQTSLITTILPEVLNVTYTITPSVSPTTTPTQSPTSFFLIGFYTLSLVCIVLIIRFGILPAINPPSQTLRGMFVLSSTVAGIAGGGVAIFFWKAARYGIGAWGGFALALWIQCFHNGGVIRTIGFRWILYIGCGVVGFALCTIPKIHYHILLISTAFVGATSFMLGVDCFTTAGLKEFYVWNLGFPSLFPKFVEHGIQFPVSQTMQIELGLTGAVALMGIAVQLRILKVLQKKMEEIAEETKQRDEEAELRAADRLTDIDRERDAWEKEHPTLSKHGRNDSTMSSVPLMKDREMSASPDHPLLHDESRSRHMSGLSDFKVAPTSDDDLKRASRMNGQIALPTLDLGNGIREDVPSSFIDNDVISKPIQVTAAELEDYKRKQELLAEIQTIRRSIDILKSETPVPPSSSEQSPSIAGQTLQPSTSHIRPPRETAPRARVHSSMEFSSLARNASDEPISRPTSVPLKDSDWDAYIQERKLLQPPAVQEAIQRRRHRESALGAATSTDSSEDVPLARVMEKKGSTGPVTILPPRRGSGNIVAPIPQ